MKAVIALTTRFLHVSGLARLARHGLVRRGCFVLELHGVSRRRLPDLPSEAQPSFSRDELEALLDFLEPSFRFLTPEDFFAADGAGPGVLLTFDDGFANQVTNALPMLEARGVPAVFFVTTQHVHNPRNWLPATRAAAEQHVDSLSSEEIHDLYDGMSVVELRRLASSPLVTVGSHTVSHPFLTRLGDVQLAAELGESKRFLEEVTGQAVDLFCYPTGDYDRRVAAAVRDAGYRAAFVEESRRLGEGRFEIPRLGLYSADEAYLSVKLSGLYRRPWEG